ncbi:MAG: S24 family peptidase [Lautropia sp.]
MAVLISSAGLTPNSVATQAKGSQPQLHRYLSGESREPRRATLAPFARFFRVSVDAFYNEALAAQIARERGLLKAGAPPPAPYPSEPGSAGMAGGAVAAGRLSPPAMLPVAGLIQGGDDGYLEGFAAPAGENAVPYHGKDADAYVLRVRGDAMASRIMSGDHLVVEPNTPPQSGDITVVIRKDGRRTVRTLLYVRDGEATLAPFNDAHRTLLLALADIAQMHKVVSIIPR